MNKRLITSDDFIEAYARVRQRGWSFIANKFSLDRLKRTTSTFNDETFEASNWWMIPRVRARWNERVSGDPGLRYEDHLMHGRLSSRSDLKMLSMGGGVCSHELYLASFAQFSSVTCIDIADQLLDVAQREADQQGLNNFQTRVGDVNKVDLGSKAYDVILFHQSLHHFESVDQLLVQKVIPALKPDGILVLNEYVGPRRLQWSKDQLKVTNELLGVLPNGYRQRFRSNRLKNKVTGPGWWRMLASDPSEAVESDLIIPTLRAHFETLEEHALGGNILALLLKDIAHHFMENNAETNALLDRLFAAEDKFLSQHQSDLIYGVYRPKR